MPKNESVTTLSEPLQALQNRLKEIGGCSNGGCRIQTPIGMHTNAGCRCLMDDKYKAIRVVEAYRTYVLAVEGKDAANAARI
jgi:hypothetical protein